MIADQQKELVSMFCLNYIHEMGFFHENERPGANEGNETYGLKGETYNTGPSDRNTQHQSPGDDY